MSLDILILAAVAVGLFVKLWSVFGTRHEDEPLYPSPFVGQPAAAVADDPAPPPAPILPPGSLAGALAAIAAADPDFNEKQFLAMARDRFTTVVTAFAAGDLQPAADMLAPALRTQLDEAIAARRQAGQSASTRVAGIDDAECIRAGIEDARAAITVRFVSRQENILRDAQGKVIGGSPGRAEEVTDRWLFTRAAGSDWVVTQTGV